MRVRLTPRVVNGKIVSWNATELHKLFGGWSAHDFGVTEDTKEKAIASLKLLKESKKMQEALTEEIDV